MQQAVQQRGGVPVGQHKAVAVGEFRIFGIVAQKFAPEHVCHVCHAHGRTGVSRIGGLNGVHGKKTQRVGGLCGHDFSFGGVSEMRGDYGSFTICLQLFERVGGGLGKGGGYLLNE